jgi:aromatic-L-amino-acid/L-tryptophan decarboxylase
LNVVCFRYAPLLDETAVDALNARVVVALQERGLAVPSTTRIGGKLAVRMNVMNHRTTQGDLDAVYDALVAVAEDALDRSTA